MAAGDPARRADGLPERAVEQPRRSPVGRDSCSASRCRERVQWIRVLLAELQRINSHLVWLGTHAHGSRRRLGDALLLPRARAAAEHQRADRRLPDVPELHPRRRPARGSARAASTRRSAQFLDRLPGEARRVRGPAHPEPDLPQAHARASGVISRADARRLRPGRARSPAPSGVDLRRAQGVPVLRLRDVRVRRADRDARATSTTATSCASRRCGRALRICRQALERITPTGAWAADDPRVVPPPKDRVYTEMEALIQHFLIYSQGFIVPAGEAYVPVEGPRGEHGCYVVSDGTNRPVAREDARRRRCWRARRCRR